jgi:glycosyltransferase involved in cell wall biosynthesis
MKICLVTAFPPSRWSLNEYGFHIAQELQRHPFLSLTVLADKLPEPVSELPEFEVVRCWTPNQTFNQPGLLKAIHEIQPDIVWFNLLFSTFGNSRHPIAAFSGLTLPALVRLSGCYTHVTLHHLMDYVDLNDSGIKSQALYRLAGSAATKILLMANSVSVLLPAYRRTLMQKYHADNVHFRMHSILTASPEFPDLAQRGNSEQRILVFGKWGTYKRLELMLEAFQTVAEQVPSVKLIVGGADHPMAAGYIESVAARYRDDPRIQFTGYVEEEDIGPLFSTASVLVMPYSSAAGASGVAHLGCAYGLPIISADIPDFRSMAEDEGLAIEFYRRDNAQALAASLLELLNSPEKQADMAEQNFSAALRMTRPQVVGQYLRSFAYDLDSRDRTARPRPISLHSAVFRAFSPEAKPALAGVAAPALAAPRSPLTPKFAVCQPGLKRLRRVPEAEVIAEFLKNEFYREEYHHDCDRFEHLVMEANLDNEAENVVRRALLFRRRGFMWNELPADTEWWEVELTAEDVDNLCVFPRAEWRKLADGSFRLADMVNRIRSARSAGRMPSFINRIELLRMRLRREQDHSALLLIGIDEHHPLTIIEGNHRATAARLASGNQVHRQFRFFCGFSPHMNRCCWYQSSVGNVWRYLLNRMKSVLSKGKARTIAIPPSDLPGEPKEEMHAGSRAA